jgi:putative endopeptidase
MREGPDSVIFKLNQSEVSMRHLRLASVLFLVVCCAVGTGVPGAAAERVLKSGIDRSTFETSVKPGENFFLYVNGTWIKHNPIPPEYSRWGAFPKLQDDNLQALRGILEGLEKESGSLDSDSQKLRDFFKTAMDEAGLEAAGASPLAARLEKIAKISGHNELISELADFHLAANPALFRAMVRPDQKQSSQYAFYLYQGGLGLPERDYYLGKTKDSEKIRAKYREHVATMLRLLGDSPAEAEKGAEVVMRIETRLAEASRTPVQLRDSEANYNKKSLSKLAQLTPHFDWSLYLKTIDAKPLSDVVVGQPEFFERVDQLVDSVPLDEWKTYLRWHLVHSTAPYLSRAFEEADFNFYSGQLRGIKQMQPRWKRATTTIDRMMGEALGRLYVAKHFTPAAKERMDELVKNLLAAYRERIQGRDWMSPETKKQALIKLAAITPKIGYPDKWRDYSALEIKPDSYAENVMRATAFEVHYRLSKLGKPVDKAEWGMTPPTVNAYYNPSMNEIVFPAGILQPPFFNAEADDAVNYGGIGAVIGHEITHGFDDQGSRYDADGNMKNWWTSEDRAKFNAKTDKLVKEYNDCVALDDLHVNGRLTLGENLADLGGVAIAYAAYQKSLEGRSAPVIDGFTGPQRFFIGFAQVWRGNIRDAEQKLRLRTDPHSPAKFRATVPVSNIEAFYEAFDVKPGDAMYRKPEDRVQVW